MILKPHFLWSFYFNIFQAVSGLVEPTEKGKYFNFFIIKLSVIVDFISLSETLGNFFCVLITLLG